MFDKLLIANRGEIACRVIRTARRIGIPTLAVYSDADRDALHVRMADEAAHIGPPPAAQSYLDIDRLMTVIAEYGVDAVHPGYGFLSENARFAEALETAGIAFVGPPKRAIEAMGDKITSKQLAMEAGVSTVPGHMGLIGSAQEALEIARNIGYPVMIKASAGGGGKGMRIAWNDEEAREGFQSSKNEAKSAFGDERIFIEKFITGPRHIEIQVLGDRHGNCIHLGERECSIQRRNQKVIEEAPSPFLDATTRAAMGEQAVTLARAVDYCSAGTVEFIVDGDRNFYFLEMNTRLQVEHPVTELITGVDLVEQMIRVAAGEKLALKQADVSMSGWAIESRLYAEDPYRGFLPSTGRLTRYRPPEEGERPDGTVVRNDTGVGEGSEISIFYDPMIAKLCTWAPGRAEAVGTMCAALDAFEIEGIGNNLPFLSAVMRHPRYRSGDLTTSFIADEWPDGFAGVDLDGAELRDLAAVAAACNYIINQRATRISGAMENHRRVVGHDWVAHLAGIELPVQVFRDGERLQVTVEDCEPRQIDIGAWRPGGTLVDAKVDEKCITVKVERRPNGFRLRHGGADLRIHVHTPRQAELYRLMPEKQPPDTSRMLLCPMPGLVVSINVSEGEEVQDGQALAVVEAMKMENILRAEKKTRVSKIHVAPGDSLAVDAVIMEFEEPDRVAAGEGKK